MTDDPTPTPEAEQEPAQPPSEDAPVVEQRPALVVPHIEKPSDPVELKKLLEELNAKKEHAFQKKQEISARIQEKIALVQEYKRQRNTLTRQVRELKVQRDVLNTQITAKIEEVKLARPKERPQVTLPLDAKGRPMKPAFMQKRIKELEHKIETVPMDFQAEQRVMKEIKQLQKQLDHINQAYGVSSDLVEKSRDIDALKKDANALHAKVTELAKGSQDYHEKMLVLGQEIDALKLKEDEVYQEFLIAKQQYVSLSGEMHEVREQERKVQQERRDQQAKERRKKEEDDQKTLQQRAHEAEEKMRKGEKLTTEDLLALQSVD